MVVALESFSKISIIEQEVFNIAFIITGEMPGIVSSEAL